MEENRLTVEDVRHVISDTQTRHEKERECTDKIVKLAREIVNTYREYNPDGKYLNMCFLISSDNDTPTLNIHNDYWRDSFKIRQTEVIRDEINRCR